MKDYYRLIYEMLNCPNGLGPEILMANPELIDEGLVETMKQVATMMAQQGNGDLADYLMYVAGELAVEMGILGDVPEWTNASGIWLPARHPREARPMSTHDFLMQVLQAVTDSRGDSRGVYPLLEANLDKLDDNFVQLLGSWATATLSQEEPEDAKDTATVIIYFSIGMMYFRSGNRAINVEIAITGFEVASLITLTANPPAWGMLQSGLSNAYYERIRGDRADNLEKAILAGKSALEVLNPATVPEGWAITKNALGLAYYARILGEREDNLEAAIGCYEAALQVETRKEFPQQWANTQNSLGIAYRHRILGDKAENIERAIVCYEAALQVHTRSVFPELWAGHQNNLGLVYTDRILGDKAENLERAIACYEAALLVHNRVAFPENWATLQHNLGRAYFFRLKGDRAENVERAIASYQAALSVRTREALPNYWARTQHNLGGAYFLRINGNRAKNLEMAIACFQNALQVHTREAFPEGWQEIQDHLAAANLALDELSLDEEVGQLLRSSRLFLNFILQVQLRTSKKVGSECVSKRAKVPKFLSQVWQAIADSQGDLKTAYPILQANLDQLNDNFVEWFRHWTVAVFSGVEPEHIAELLCQLKTTKLFQMNGEKACVQQLWLALDIFYFSHLMLQFPLGSQAINSEIAIIGYEVLATVFTRESLPEQWAITQNKLAIAYARRIKGERAENLEAAIDACQSALQVFTREDFPEEWASTQINLGSDYCQRICGKRAENLELAIACFQNAAQVYTRQDFTKQWANIQDALTVAYCHRIRGDRAENLEMAIAFSGQALQVITREEFPESWAEIQHNLGLVYCYRIKGDQSENTEMAIACYQNVLQIHTREAFPADWAAAQSNLGIVYRDRICGDRLENIEMAIYCYQKALQVRTKEAFPEKWAETQMNLGSAYRYRIKGDRSENLEMAIACAENALQVRTRETFPNEWARTQINLGNAYHARIRGDRRENLKKALAAKEASLQVHTRTTFPYEWAMTQLNLGTFYGSLELIDAAMTCSRSALEVLTPTAFPVECLRTGRYLGHMAFAAGRWAEAIEGYGVAIEAVETSRTWATSESRRQEILAEVIGIYENTVQACVNTGQVDKALETVERSRSKRLLDLMASNDLYSGGEIPREVQQYLQQYENLQRQIDQERSQNNTDSSREQGGTCTLRRAAWKPYNDAIAALESQKHQIWEQLRRLDPVLAGQIQVSAPKFDTIQQLICQPTTAILSFYTTANDTHIFVVRQNQGDPPGIPYIHTCTGQGFETLQHWIFANWLLPYLDDKDQWKSQVSTVLTELAQRLQLDELIADHLSGIEELILVPHLLLHQIPFAALPVASSPPLTGGQGGVLGDKFRIRYTPSCQVLEFCHKRPRVGDRLTYGTVEDATGDLPCASFEGEQIAQMHNIPDDLRLKGSREAKVENYRQLVNNVQAILSSHHAQSRLDNPLESELKLADGSITLGQLMTPGWRMPHLSDVFLSCCETGLGVTEITDEILTLSTGFLCAGARCVVSSLWSVDDLATALFSIFYHRHRLQGFNRPEALRRSQVELRTLSGDTLATVYKPPLAHLLEQKLKSADAARREAKKERDRHPKGSVAYQQSDEEFERLNNVATKIYNSKKDLNSFCRASFPFSHPFYWAAFTCSGLQ